jgi:hypothetical protein
VKTSPLQRCCRALVGLGIHSAPYGLGSVNPLRVNLCSNTGMPAAVLPFWQASIAVNASTSTLRPCAFWT